MLGAVAVTAGVSTPLAEHTESVPSHVAPTRPAPLPGSPSTPARPGASPTSTPAFPNVVGDTLEQAQQAVVAAKLLARVAASAVVVNPSVPPETVVSQTGDHLTIAVPDDAACTQAQLAATYQFGQGGGGNLFAAIVVRNVSATWCAIASPVTLAGLASTGQRVTNAPSAALSHPHVDVLSPNTPPISTKGGFFTGSGTGDDYPVNVLFAEVDFSGPSNTCATDIPGNSTPHVSPAEWRLSFPQGISLSVTNGTRAKATQPPVNSADYTAHPFSSCGGSISMVGATVR